MSTKSTSLSGDLSLGRNLAVGGRADVQGSATVHHNLKVEGWLDAKNIKGANKGVFTTIEKLKEAYPNGTLPEGSWAIVGGTLPGELWYVSGGVWVDSGKTAGSVTVDVESYLEEIQSLSGEVSTLQDDVSDIQDKDKSQDNQITTISNIATANSNSITQLQTNLATETSERKSADTTLQGNIDSLKTQLQTNLATETSERKSADTTLQGNIDSLKEELESLLGDSASDAIDNFNEILAFLNGVKDSETLTALLEAIRTRLTSLETLQGQGYRLVGIATPTTTPVTSSGNIAYIAAVPGTYTNFTAQKLNSDGTSEEVAIELADGEVALLFKQNYDKSQVVGWGKSVLNISDAVEAIVKDRLAGVEGGVAPLNREGVVPLDFLPEEATVAGNIMVEEWSDSVDSSYTPTVPDGYFYNPTDKKLYKSYANSDGDFMIKAVMPNTSTIYVNKPENVPYRWTGSDMVAIAAKNISASIFNPTVEVPISGYYVLCDTDNTSLSAVHAAWNAKKAASGLILSFELSAGVWKTYQYIGKSVTETNWLNTDNWQDFGSLAAGSETYIVIDGLPQTNKVGDFYTLETAVQALLYCQEKTGVTYSKKGLIIAYSIAANEMETKQFQGEVTDIAEVGLWKDFGGGSEVETKDDPAEGGTDALSTGGAFKNIPVRIKADTETEGVVKLQLNNAAGEAVGDEVQFPVGTGSGGGAGTIVSLAFENVPLYAQAGGAVTIKAAVRSVTTQGANESENMIEKIELVDRDTSQILETLTVNKASSASLTTYDFQIDVSSYFATAGQRRFKVIATDDGGNTGSKSINVIAVDVTLQSVQTLNYTQSTALAVGGEAKSLPMYKFPNNASDKGILATTEIFLKGEWQTLGTATVMDTYSHSVTIDPSSCLGVALSHGAYPLRIHGVDVGSGVVGNYLHTAVMVVDENDTTPIVATRWYSETESDVKKLYETLSLDYAVYDPESQEPTAEVYEDGVLKASRVAYRSQTYTYTRKITDVAYDGSVTINISVKCDEGVSQTTDVKVSGTLLEVEEVSTQRQFSLDFSGRSNSESEHNIADSGVTLDVEGVNWSTNGFVKDSFGTTATDGDMALRMAENAKGTLHYKPFAESDIETNGMALQFTIMKKNIADDSTKLMQCIADGFGFYVDGQNVVFTIDDGATVAHTITAALDDSEKTNVAIVIEPSAVAPYSGIGVAKMYFDGEEIGACYYTAGSLVAHDTEITFDSTNGDLYLYNIKAWKTYFGFEQEFNNYLLTMTDTDAMISEYEFNDVMASQTAENTTKNRPQAAPLYALGLPYFVLCKNADTADNDAKDNYPEYLETLDGDKKTKRILDVYAYFPDRPWQDFKAIGVTVTNQGTTSSKRPIKNIKMKFKGSTITLLHTASDFTGAELEKFNVCLANAAKGKVQVADDSLPTNIITVKVDYSESGGANNGGSTNLFNDLQRGLGDNYVTPAQKVYNASGTGYIINTSIRSIPCAFFRTDRYSADATSPSYGYFHAKGNWNEDKGDAKVFGFEDVDGYNAGCLNYGDFIELVAAQGQSLSDFAASVDKSTWVQTNDEGAENIYVLSEFCGPSHKVYRYKNGAWTETTGNMTYTGGKWVITGDVVNPVENYELLKYDGLDWFVGVDSVDDMLTLDTDGKPIWLQYFESRYPDDDNLNALYEAGKKVPYWLYNWLKFCQDCNQNLTTGNITLGGKTTTGTKANRLKKWQQELHTVANVHSALCYHVFTDYVAAVDQRAKNMMIGFYLDEDGVTRMYLNHLYDGDTILGSDNDCGLTIPALLDPNDDDAGVYQGHGSVLFTQIANMGTDGFWLDDTGKNTVTTRQVAAAMRAYTTSDGLRAFSYDGIVKYWITDRLQKWPKKVSSFDGERKYIEASKSTANYFYALHGLSIKRLKDFVKTRFLFRDGFYQTGDLFSSMVSMRCTGTNVTVKITAAKQGYFGIGVDRANTATDSCYLKAGESYTLKSGMTNTGSGTMLYVFGADKLAKLDISNATPSQQSWDISELTLIKELIIGGESYTLANNNEGYLTILDLGNLPFLEKLDIQNTAITTVNASYCPRLLSVLAVGSKLTRIQLAEQSAITKLTLPTTYKYLSLRYLPSLTNSGITFANAAGIETLIIEGCTNIDAWALLMKVAGTTNTALKYVRVTGLAESGDGTDLTTLAALGLQGVDATLQAGGEVAISGKYQLTKYVDDEQLATWREALPELTINQALYSDYVEDDLVEDSENVSNMDNGTGYDFSNDYVPSGHVLKIRAKSVPVKGQYDAKTKTMTLTKMSESDYTKYADGTKFDNTDNLGEQYDCFMYIPKYWYKGINDFKTQKKHTLLSSNITMPEATYTKKNEPKLSEILYAEAKGLQVGSLTVGSAYSDDCLKTLSSCSVYRLDVEGMKQARFPTINNVSYGSAFVDADGKVLETDTLTISGTTNSPLDFTAEQGDYVYRDVPTGAKWLYFTCYKGLSDDVMVRSVDSSDIEALEDWVEHKSTLIGIYGGALDDLGYMRSISGKQTRTGDGTSTTYANWSYDSEGNPTAMPVGTVHYTYQDLLNLCILRGDGYHSTDYEQGKAIAILSRCYTGNRDDQRVYGFGCGARYTTGQCDSIGKTDTVNGADSGKPNKIWGLEGFVGCNWELMDNIGCNIKTFASWKASKRAENYSDDMVDAVYHIYDPRTKTERTVQGITTNGYEIARIKHGRFCDTLASATNNDSQKFSTCHASAYYYSASKGRCVGRASSYASASGGLVYSYAYYASSYSSTYVGVRLAFDGEIANESDVDSEIA